MPSTLQRRTDIPLGYESVIEQHGVESAEMPFWDVFAKVTQSQQNAQFYRTQRSLAVLERRLADLTQNGAEPTAAENAARQFLRVFQMSPITPSAVVPTELGMGIVISYGEKRAEVEFDGSQQAALVMYAAYGPITVSYFDWMTNPQQGLLEILSYLK